MIKIDRYVLKEMFLPTLFGISLITFALMIDIIRSIAETLIVKSVPLMEILAMFSYLTPQIMVQTVPLGIFFGIMMTYNNMSTTSEMVAMQSSGMSINRILRMPLFLGVVVTLGIYGFQEKVQPLAQKKADMLMKKIAYSKPTAQLQPKQFVSDVGNMSVYVEDVTEDGKAKNLIAFLKSGDSEFSQVIMAKETDFTNSEIIINDAKTYTVLPNEIKDENRKVYTLLEGSIKQRVTPISSFFGDPRKTKITKESLGIRELIRTIKEKKSIGDEYKVFETELYKKIYSPLSAIFFALLGPLLSIRHSRTIKGLNLGMSLGIILAYMGVQDALLAMAENNQIEPFLLFIPNLILLVITIFSYRVQSRR